MPPAPSAEGFLHIDDNYGLDEAIRKEIAKVIPLLKSVELSFARP